MQTPDLSRAVAAAQLLANSIKLPIAVYSRTHCHVGGTCEWKILPESDPEPAGFKREQLVQPKPGTK